MLALIGLGIWLIVVKVRARQGVEAALEESAEKPHREAESELQFKDESHVHDNSNNPRLRPMVNPK